MKQHLIYTTSAVAEVLKVSPRTVSNWFESGRIKGFRLPGSQSIRIPHQYLEAFANEHGMVMNFEPIPAPRPGATT